ncbi:Junctional sarcoplasmic reticulum protein 1 [Apodemus speciosus]|uniref:Junctional sarcoplasmic reticulum protein 1 n=1 Tax=Apodemus speciosus TaxID=105296 RepID=A0ABQ0F7V8_APOSI
MTTRGLEDLDGGLGSCVPSDDLSFLEEPPSGRRPDGKARGSGGGDGTRSLGDGGQPTVLPTGASRLADSSSCTRVLQDSVNTGAGDSRLKKMEKELEGKESTTTGKAGTSPRSVPARRKQAAPPLQPLPPPPPSEDDLPWGDLTLNKCLVLASLVALLGSALQLCRDTDVTEPGPPTPSSEQGSTPHPGAPTLFSGDVVAGEAAAPQQWVPPSSPPKKEVLAAAAAPKPPVLVPPSGPPQPKPGPPAPQVQMQDGPELRGSPEATETQVEPGGSISEASGEESTPREGGGSQEKPQKEKPRKGEKWKKEKPRREKQRREKPRREEKPQVTREHRQSLPRRSWEVQERGHQPWRRDSRDLEHGKRQAWAPLRRHDLDDRPRQKPRGGKGRD